MTTTAKIELAAGNVKAIRAHGSALAAGIIKADAVHAGTLGKVYAAAIKQFEQDVKKVGAAHVKLILAEFKTGFAQSAIEAGITWSEKTVQNKLSVFNGIARLLAKDVDASALVAGCTSEAQVKSAVTKAEEAAGTSTGRGAKADAGKDADKDGKGAKPDGKEKTATGAATVKPADVDLLAPQAIGAALGLITRTLKSIPDANGDKASALEALDEIIGLIFAEYPAVKKVAAEAGKGKGK